MFVSSRSLWYSKSLEPYDWLKLVVKLFPSVSSLPALVSSSQPTLRLLWHILSPWSQPWPCHVCQKDVLWTSRLRASYPGFWRAVKPDVLSPGERNCEKENRNNTPNFGPTFWVAKIIHPLWAYMSQQQLTYFLWTVFIGVLNSAKQKVETSFGVYQIWREHFSGTNISVPLF